MESCQDKTRGTTLGVQWAIRFKRERHGVVHSGILGLRARDVESCQEKTRGTTFGVQRAIRFKRERHGFVRVKIRLPATILGVPWGIRFKIVQAERKWS